MIAQVPLCTLKIFQLLTWSSRSASKRCRIVQHTEKPSCLYIYHSSSMVRVTVGGAVDSPKIHEQHTKTRKRKGTVSRDGFGFS